MRATAKEFVPRAETVRMIITPTEPRTMSPLSEQGGPAADLPYHLKKEIVKYLGDYEITALTITMRKLPHRLIGKLGTHLSVANIRYPLPRMEQPLPLPVRTVADPVPEKATNVAEQMVKQLRDALAPYSPPPQPEQRFTLSNTLCSATLADATAAPQPVTNMSPSRPLLMNPAYADEQIFTCQLQQHEQGGWATALTYRLKKDVDKYLEDYEITVLTITMRKLPHQLIGKLTTHFSAICFRDPPPRMEQPVPLPVHDVADPIPEEVLDQMQTYLRDALAPYLNHPQSEQRFTLSDPVWSATPSDVTAVPKPVTNVTPLRPPPGLF